MELPKKLKEITGLLSTAIMGIINQNRFSIIQEIDENRDAYIRNKIEFKDIRKVVDHVRSWLDTNGKSFNVIDYDYNDGDSELTWLFFEYENIKWKIPLIINEFTEGGAFVEHYNSVSVWINTYVAERI